MDKNPSIGSLRYAISIYKREDVPDPQSAGLLPSLELIAETVADIQPTGPMTFYGSISADYEKPVSHKIYIRWMTPFDSNFDLTYQINRTLNTPDDRKRTEVFRVWRIEEINGRQRFICFWTQLESVSSV